ncbi:hypothetical protein CAPTEDRAFT_186693 [Capitella teleta]|uniref:Uncharacterized protein n=1 Tax=Capitella teleta TaxID=283909 RepID=R7TYC8_CAPTE|nr:hypothetical protein CAPTEDRAFT_186693 [Capitella teleta]|eukprot:ELT95970.1 hypothetical protein CAPTEDRAFT_186693 [Capitella teleta]
MERRLPYKITLHVLGRPSTQQDPSNNVSLHQRRMIKMSQIDPQLAADVLNTTSPLDCTLDDTDTIVDEINNMLYNIASNARIATSPAAQRTDADVRWKDLLENNNSRTLWKAVNWNGSIASPEKEDNRRNDDAFRVHFEELLNPVNEQTNFLSDSPNDPVHLPATDDPIRPSEVQEATQTLKTSKRGGPSGIPPDFFDYSQMLRFYSLQHLFRLSSLQGLRFKPDREQAGSQLGRGCTEHLMTLRLWIDYAKHKKKKLYLVFVDFSKAYDRVPRQLLLQRLLARGCETTMVRTLAVIYKTTKMILRSATITAFVGKKTLERFIDERSDLTDDPLMFTLEKCRTANTPCARYIRSLDQHDYDHENQILKEKARTSTRTKYRTYCNLMNPELKGMGN